jgi:hypothetical protein
MVLLSSATSYLHNQITPAIQDAAIQMQAYLQPLEQAILIQVRHVRPHQALQACQPGGGELLLLGCQA